MFSLMLHKITHKKWMVLCLLIGNILLISVAVSYPLYRVSSFQKMLNDEFSNFEKEENSYPAIFSVNNSIMSGRGEGEFTTVESEAINAVEQLNISVMDTVVNYYF